MGRNNKDFSHGIDPHWEDVAQAKMHGFITNEEALDLAPKMHKGIEHAMPAESNFIINREHKRAGIADINSLDSLNRIQERKGE